MQQKESGGIRGEEERRMELQLIVEILSTGSAVKRKILHHCALDHHQFKRYAPFLVEKGMLEMMSTDGEVVYSTDGEVVYITTEKGHRIVRLCKELEELLGISYFPYS